MSVQLEYSNEVQPLKRVRAEGLSSWMVSVGKTERGVWIGTSNKGKDSCTGPTISHADWKAIVELVENAEWI